MSGLSKMFKPKMPDDPKTVRMPTETDPDILAASQRTREAAMRRTGRLSTIMTDQTQGITGSSGMKLGA